MTEKSHYRVVALYKFIKLSNISEKKIQLEAFCAAHKIKGTILLANEGLNGTVALSDDGIQSFIAYLCKLIGAASIDYKTAYTDQEPFYRMKVRLKKEIVTMGHADIDPNKHAGTYLNAAEWNTLIQDPDTLVLDTRNDYEYEVGTFKGAIDPNIKTFRSFPEYVKNHCDPKKHKKVAMFCTGGIRCEKASAYMLQEGFEEVYHLKGGILKYFEETNKDTSLWNGECFVFDNRITVDENLKAGKYQQCYACRAAITEQDMSSTEYIKGVSCPKCFDKTNASKKARAAERQKQSDLAAQSGQYHVGGQQRQLKA